MSYLERREASARRRVANRKRGEKRKHRRVRARPLVPNTRYMITRRTLERRMFMLPDEEHGKDIAQFFGYTLGLALQDSGQQLHASTAMSNHHHTIATDTEADADSHRSMPAFKNKFHAFIARGINAKRGRFECFWSGDAPCDIEQLTDEETLEDIVYAYTNPVKAGLVKWARQWTGFSTYGWKFGESRRFWRPKWFYDPENPDIPDYVDIVLVRPDIFPELSDDELYDLIMKKVRERELELHAEIAEKGGGFMSRKKFLKQKWDRPAKSVEERFTLTPKVASTCKWVRIARLQRQREWDAQYAAAYEEQLAGGDPIFPPGTYWMRRFAGVRVAGAP